MIILKEQRKDCVVMHIIMGEEAELQLDFGGSFDADITQIVKDLAESGQKVVMHLNRCRSEEIVAEQILGSLPPHLQKQMLEDSYNQSSFDSGCESSNDPSESDDLFQIEFESNAKKTSDKEKSNTPQKPRNIQCPLCKNNKGNMTKHGVIVPCNTCKKIESARELGIPPAEKPLTYEDQVCIFAELAKRDKTGAMKEFLQSILNESNEE